MPPTPIVRVELREDVYDRLCLDLGLKEKPKVKIISSQSKAELSGKWNAIGNITTVFAGLSAYESMRLTHAAHELSRVILHETRHAWQYETWGIEAFNLDDRLPYAHRKKEVDAREFEESNVAKYNLVRISRKHPSSSMSRLAAIEHNIRRSV